MLFSSVSFYVTSNHRAKYKSEFMIVSMAINNNDTGLLKHLNKDSWLYIETYSMINAKTQLTYYLFVKCLFDWAILQKRIAYPLYQRCKHQIHILHDRYVHNYKSPRILQRKRRATAASRPRAPERENRTRDSVIVSFVAFVNDCNIIRDLQSSVFTDRDWRARCCHLKRWDIWLVWWGWWLRH